MGWKDILRKESDAWEMSQDWGTSTPQDHPDWDLTSEEMAAKYSPGEWDGGDNYVVHRYVELESGEEIIINDSFDSPFSEMEYPDMTTEIGDFWEVEHEGIDSMVRDKEIPFPFKGAGIKIYEYTDHYPLDKTRPKKLVEEKYWTLEEMLRDHRPWYHLETPEYPADDL